MSIGLLIVRVIVGALFMGHGAQKLFGWFGGHGVDGTAGFLRSVGFRSRAWAIVAGLAELLGGLLLGLGFVTPLAAAAIVGVMTAAMLAVHVDRGVWNADGGVELPLVYAAVATGLAFTGPGDYSVDALIGLSWDPAVQGVVALALGVLSGLAVNAGRTEAPVAASQPTSEPSPAEPRAA